MALATYRGYGNPALYYLRDALSTVPYRDWANVEERFFSFAFRIQDSFLPPSEEGGGLRSKTEGETLSNP
ncbi:MAG: hypothetical protein IJM96_04655, partial [Clostridia bacterium]|nr:hypothetical protein [Clostridia bacterium]